jgi:glycosyltransferase involved in cell wall biosynthesis
MRAPLLSVIVATHRRPLLLARTLESLRQQSYQDFQTVLCADEGSPETKMVAARYLKDGDTFLVLPETKGPAGSRNAGLGLARGKCVVFLDDDDTFDKDHLAMVATELESCAESVLFASYTEVTEFRAAGSITIKQARQTSIKNRPVGSLWVVNFIPNNSVVVRSDVAKRVSFDMRLQSHEDWDYLLGLLSIAEFRHIEMFGARVHFSENPAEHRNNACKLDRSMALDFLSIYRKWPAPDEQIRVQRAATLQGMGLHVAQQFL